MERKVSTSNSHTQRYLNEDAFPTIFPNCPQYLSKKKPVPRTSNTTSSERQAIEDTKTGRQGKKEMQLDSIKLLEDL